MAETSPGDCKNDFSITPTDVAVTDTSKDPTIVMKQDHFGTSANGE